MSTAVMASTGTLAKVASSACGPRASLRAPASFSHHHPQGLAWPGARQLACLDKPISMASSFNSCPLALCPTALVPSALVPFHAMPRLLPTQLPTLPSQSHTSRLLEQSRCRGPGSHGDELVTCLWNPKDRQSIKHLCATVPEEWPTSGVGGLTSHSV